jgi:hypothetical protein
MQFAGGFSRQDVSSKWAVVPDLFRTSDPEKDGVNGPMCKNPCYYMAFSLILAVTPVTNAQQWANEMFVEGREHDFGTVARGADVEYRFPVKNLYRQDIELTGVRSSCGCTTPSVETKLLKTHETGYIVAKFNTRTFTGVKGATLTVKMKWTDIKGINRSGEAQLRINGEIRGDVVFKPGAVQFESVNQGTQAEKRINVSYAGRSRWEITDVLSRSEDFEVELVQRDRKSGRVSYDLLVRLKDTAPAGDLREQLVLVTNDRSEQRIPVLIEGKVVPVVSVAPNSVVFGEVAQGQEVSKKVLVRGKKPFRIIDIYCDDDSLKFQTPSESATRHIVNFQFTASGKPGKVEDKVNIVTDLGQNYGARCNVYATIMPSTTAADVVEKPTTDAVSAGTAKRVIAGQ